MLSHEYLYCQEDSRLANVVAFYILRHIYCCGRKKFRMVSLDAILSIIGLVASCITIQKSPNLRIYSIKYLARRQSYLAAPYEADRAAASGVQRHQRVERRLVGGGGESEGRLQV